MRRYQGCSVTGHALLVYEHCYLNRTYSPVVRPHHPRVQDGMSFAANGLMDLLNVKGARWQALVLRTQSLESEFEG